MRRGFRVLLAAALLTVAVSGAASAQAMRSGFSSSSLGPNDDFYVTPPAAFGFSINFFGSFYTGAYLNNNGNMTFLVPLSTYTPFGITGGTTPMIAPFFADVDTRAGPLMTYGTSTVNGNAAFGVTWNGVCFFYINCSLTNAFQVVLIDRSADFAAGDFDIEFNYDYINWEVGDASSGTGGLCNGAPDYPAVAGYTTGAGSYSQLPGSGVCGGFLDGGPYALSENSYNSSQVGRYVFAVRNGTPETVVPEPITIALLGTGLVGIGAAKRRRKQESDL
jgi:hypothetical protein